MLALTVVSCRIRRISQLGEQIEELDRLADKQPHVGQELPGARGGALGLGQAPVFADSGGSESKCLKIRDRSKKVCATGPPSLSQELCNGLISKEKELDDLTLSNGYDGRAGSLSRPRSLQANQSDARATPRA
jgi:hypothetical protein